MGIVRLILIVLSIALVMYAAVLIAMTDRPLETAVPLATVALVIGTTVWAFIAVRRRRRRANMVLNYLEQAVRLNLPLPQVVAAMREQEGGRFARTIAQVQDALAAGAPVAAVLAAMPEVPTRIVALAAGAERVGRLPQVLGRIMEERRALIMRRAAMGRTPAVRAYPLALVLSFLTAAGFLLVFVFPKFQQIFKDFKMQMPPVTQALLEVANDIGPILIVIAAAALVLYILRMIIEVWNGPGNVILGLGSVEWALDRLPLIGPMRNNRSLGDALSFAADALEGGRTLEAALSESAGVVSRGRLRPRFDRWVAELVGGRPIAEAARLAGMPRMVSGMLSVPSRDETTIAETFRFLGRYYSNRFSRTAMLLEAASVPALAFGMGALVLWLALSIFVPMVSLCDTLTVPTHRWMIR